MELALAGGVALTGGLPHQLLLLCANCGLWNGVGSLLVATHQHLNRQPTTNRSQVSIQMSGPIHAHMYLDLTRPGSGVILHSLSSTPPCCLRGNNHMLAVFLVLVESM